MFRVNKARRIENMIYSTGGVLWQELESMRLHPDYESEILPHIERVMIDYKAGGKPPAVVGPVLTVMKQIENDAKFRITDASKVRLLYEKRIA